MRYRGRKTFRFGPLFFSFSQNGFTSWGVKIGPYTYNATRKRSSLDTPGIGGIRHQHGKKDRA